MVWHFDLTGTWQIHQGFPYSVRFTFPGDFDLTGHTAVIQIRRGPGAADPAYLDAVPSVDQDDDDAWYVEIALDDTETAAIPAVKGADWEMAISTGGSTVMGFEGKVDVRPGVIA